MFCPISHTCTHIHTHVRTHAYTSTCNPTCTCLVLPHMYAHPPQAKYMRQIVLSGLGDHVARKIPTQGLDVEDKKRLRYAYQVCDVADITIPPLQSSLCADLVLMLLLLIPLPPMYRPCPLVVVVVVVDTTPPMYRPCPLVVVVVDTTPPPPMYLPCPLVVVDTTPPLQSSLCTDPVHMNSSAVLLHQLPEFVVFQEITETSKLYMRGVCAVDASWFPRIQPDHCTFSPPLEDPPPFFDDATGTVCCHMTCTYGA